MYRDGANYKNHSEVIFTNPENISLEEAEKIIRQKLIDETWFYVDQWHLKDMHFKTWDNEIDHTWHEFVWLEYTDQPAAQSQTWSEFVAGIKIK